MIATKTVEWKDFLAYYPYGADDDKSQILRNIGIAAAEVMSLYDIFCEDFYDDGQCGVKEYCFADLEGKGFFVMDVLSVSVGGVCLSRDNEHCGMDECTFSVSHDCSKITINPPPREDCPIKVTAKLGIDLRNICELPEKFFLKYAVHIANYAIYKQEISSRGEEKSKTRAQVDRLYRDAVQFFENNQCNQMVGFAVTAGTSSPVRFSVC